ncbi:glycoside hydrolase family 38 C-terminal domain-containing protein [Aquisphaera insulae]|uniref:glycoside hydrolase family 38 N-terminal domain-containing protein n=1 Tax=Aquisphaera insulae TaxID=2712864 RepID=UPI0013EB72DC|nr:glycoside hydrolase family 38 C-terminal domain-containing protein [Aquisphaera insulae]
MSRYTRSLAIFAAMAACAAWGGREARAGTFTKVKPLNVTITGSAEPFSNSYLAESLLVPLTADVGHAEYASRGKAAATYVDFDLGAAAKVAVFRHVQRATPDVIATSELIFSNTPDFSKVLKTVPVTHEATQAATTVASFEPVESRYVRWQVRTLIPGSSPNVGGKRIEFFAVDGSDAEPSALKLEVHAGLILTNQPSGVPTQPIEVSIESPYAEAIPATVQINGVEPRAQKLHYGRQVATFEWPASEVARKLDARVRIANRDVAGRTFDLPPSRRLTVYILPHSHTDIGYTAIQTDIEEKQINNVLLGLAEAKRTANYPEGARFVWNIEQTWAARLFLDRMPEARRNELLEGIKKGQIGLNGMFLNTLTGLCRPEELLHLFRDSTRIGAQAGVPVDSAMISDVPGYTWGTVTAMNQAGIRYFSVAPNFFDRIGTILTQWENKPFWWVGPDGKSKVLVWIPYKGYAMSMIYRHPSPDFVQQYCDGLEKHHYPYDIAYIRWAGFPDNAEPDGSLSEFVRDWNAAHASPRFVISTTSDAFRAFERQYGDKLPRVAGDWSPYWEDGAGSSAAETVLNRASSDRLAQAETLWAMKSPGSFPADQFEKAWVNTLLYSEHTWGAHCSVTQPEIPFTIDQWTIKQSYATAANLQSRRLLTAAQQVGGGFKAREVPYDGPQRTTFVDVYNTSSWPRTGIATLPHEISDVGDFVTTESNQPVAAQRMGTGELAVWVQDLAPLSGRRLVIHNQGTTPPLPPLSVEGHTISNRSIKVRVDESTGGIAELQAPGIADNLVDTKSGHALNEYLYLPGDDLAGLRRNETPRISVFEKGPLMVSLLVESDAPGCHKLKRVIRLSAHADHVEILNTVDKARLAAANYIDKTGKESVNFAFPFLVPGGEFRLDVPLGVFRPEAEQIPSACKNWLTVSRWADLSNADHGVTWVTLDAPLVQLGGITARFLNSQGDPATWRKTIEPTQALYSWAMNNHWHTNYRAYQEGPVVFRFALRPHRGPTNDAEATRFATSLSQPLVALPGRGEAPSGEPLLRVEPADVIIAGLKPADDGKGLVIRLFGAGPEAKAARVRDGKGQPLAVRLSDTTERVGEVINGEIPVPGHGLVTVRAELP